jgi:hypothetical protein
MKSKGVGIETPYSHAHKHILLHQMLYLSLTCQTWPKTTREELMHWLALEQGDWKFPELHRRNSSFTETRTLFRLGWLPSVVIPNGPSSQNDDGVETFF